MSKTITPVSAWQLIPRSFELVRSNIVPLTYIVLLPSLVWVLGATLLGNPVRPDGTFAPLNEQQQRGLLIMAAGLILTAVNAGPSMRLMLDAAKGDVHPLLHYYRRGLPMTPKVIILYVVYTALVFGGLILLIVPGLYALQRFLLMPYIAVDKNLSIKDSLKQSAAIGKQHRDAVWGVIGVIIVFNLLSVILGSIALVGSIIAQLLTLVITFVIVLRYRELASKK